MMRSACVIVIVCMLIVVVRSVPVTPDLRWRDGVSILRPKGAAKGVVLLLYGGSGLRIRARALGADLTDLDYAVMTASLETFAAWNAARRAGCTAPARDLAAFAAEIAAGQIVGVPGKPVLVGLGTGAALAYAAAARDGTPAFHTVLSLDFCPMLPPEITPCTGSRHLEPQRALHPGWFVFQRSEGIACPLETIRQFVGRIDNAKLTVVGAGGPAEREFRAIMQWLDPSNARQSESSRDLNGVPVIEVPGRGHDRHLALFLTGDGGWAELDRSLSTRLGEQGIATVGWDSLSYFWRARTADELAADLERTLRYYLAAWARDRIVLVGYSFGADVLPFAVSRLPAELRGRIDLLALLGLGPTASFEFHLAQWLGEEQGETFEVAPELAKLEDLRVLCVYGEDEDADDTLCPALKPPVRLEKMHGDHHFDADYDGIVTAIMRELHARP